MPVSASTAATKSISPRLRICTGDRLTATNIFGQRAPSASARRSTISPSLIISPLSSASAMNSDGAIAPRVG